MSKAIKIKKRTLFYIINTLIILFFVIFYGYRLIHYYLLQNTTKLNNTTDKQQVILVDDLLKYISYIDMDNGLIDNEDDTYTYKGESTKNYVKYSGRIWRIIDIDQDKNMRMVRDSSDTIFIQDAAIKYQNTALKNWLEYNESVANSGIYFKSLNKQSEYLEKSLVCMDKIDDVTKITCDDIYGNDYTTLLSLYDYKKTGGAEGYLNNGEDWWLTTSTTNNFYWYVSSDGGLMEGKMIGSSHGIRPVVTIRNYTVLLSGTGTKEDPYIIDNTKANTLSDTIVSSYVKFSGYTWKIIAKETDKIQLALDGYIKDNDKEIELAYGSSSFNTSKNSLGYYLNNDFYNSLENKDYILKANWYTGSYTTYNKYDYRDVYKSKYSANVGLLKIGDLFVNDYADVFLLNRPYDNNSIIYSINSDNIFFADFTKTKKKIRPSLYLESDIKIVAGDGTALNPYELEVASDEKK